jgi:DNA-binding NtrC family response regulator
LFPTLGARLTEEGKKILIVDDDEAIRVMVEHVLRREKYEVDVARDGYEAIQKLADSDYNTILLDLMMPRIDGLGVLKYLEKNRPELGRSVIIMTANLPGAVEAVRKGKISHVLAKPFDLSQLLNEVRRCSSASA